MDFRLLRLLPVAACAALPFAAFMATAAPPTLKSRADEGVVEPSATRIRLAYVDAKWSRVLQDFAKAANLELVADQYPSKKFHRLDASKYSLPDAQKILAVELEKLGYRLKAEDGKLYLTSKAVTRQQYARPQTPKPLETANAVDETPEPRKTFAASTIRPAPKAVDARVAEPRRPKKTVQTAASEEPAAAPKRTAKPIRPVELTTSSIRLRHQSALKVARNIYEGFKPHAELVDAGPRGLPAFHVLVPESSTDATPRLTISIDEAHNELVVQAGHDDANASARLIQQLDVPAAPGRAVRAVATTKDVEKVAQLLQKRVNELAQLPRNLKIAQGQRNNQNADQPEQPQPGQPPQNGQEEQVIKQLRPGQGLPGPAELKAQLELRGQVDIEALPDLGVLIVRGNKDDVEKVMAIIRQIEQLSIGTAPDIEIIYLQHVSAEGLSALLTDVYTRLSTVRTGNLQQTQRVSVLPLARPNAILVLASKADMDDVRDLARKLDRPSDPETEYRVFRLKRAVASQVQQHIADLYPAATTGATTALATQGANAATSPPGLSPRIRVTVDVRMNALIVQARPRDVEEIAALIRDLDQGKPESAAQIKIFPLENARADELATTLQDAIQATINPPRQSTAQGVNQFQAGAQTTGPQELRDAKSTVLQFLQINGEDEQEYRSGILSDIRINPDIRTNSVVVIAPEESMALMEALVRQFDRPSSAVAEIKVFTLVNGDASTMLTLLQQLFTQTATGQGQQAANVGIQLAGAEDASSTLIPLKFSVDTRTNSIIAVGGGEALRVVEAILLRLDQSDLRQREIQVYKLRNAPAADISNAINQFLASQRDLQTSDPNLYSPFAQLEREVIVVPETVTNSLLISATPRYFKDIQNVIAKFDIPPLQVMIQAMLVEVTLDNSDEWGVELGIQDSILFSRSVLQAPVTINQSVTQPNGNVTTNQTIISQTGTPGYLFNNAPLGNNLGVPGSGTFAGQALSNFALARANADLGYGGLVLSGGSESLSVLLRALSARRRVDILSRPQIRVADNQLAQIQVGSQFPRVEGLTVNQTTGNATPVTNPVDLGIILQVIPRITPERNVVMEIVATKSALQPGAGVTIFTNPDGGVITSPVVDITTARTTLGVRSGQTVAMGGMITKNEAHTERKVPFLGDIPILGIPFRYDLHQMRRTELIIFLTPRVITNDYESEMLKQIEMDRLHFIECEAEEVHGPLRAFPDALSGPPSSTEVYDSLHQGTVGPAPDAGGGLYPPAMPAPPGGVGDLYPPIPQSTLPPYSPPDATPPALPKRPGARSQKGQDKDPENVAASSRVKVTVHEIPQK